MEKKTKPMIGIINYGMGNLFSVFNALKYLGVEAEIILNPTRISQAERIIIPGVGAFGDCISNLSEKGFVDILNKFVLADKKPALGICLGMQVMATRSFEGGKTNRGLGWIDADVVKISPHDSRLKVPQIGWNNIVREKNHPILKGLPESPDFYFVHSFHMKCRQQEDILAVCDYGGEVTAAIAKENICTTQFHPEKSQDYGLKILENFLTWNP